MRVELKNPPRILIIQPLVTKESITRFTQTKLDTPFLYEMCMYERDRQRIHVCMLVHMCVVKIIGLSVFSFSAALQCWFYSLFTGLLKPMETAPCLIKTVDWWTYEFCYGSVIKQYHLEGKNKCYCILHIMQVVYA